MLFQYFPINIAADWYESQYFSRLFLRLSGYAESVFCVLFIDFAHLLLQM